MKKLLTARRLGLGHKRSLLGVVFVAPWLIGFIVLFLVPLYQSLTYSFQSLRIEEGGFQSESAGFGNYKDLFYTDPTFRKDLLDAVQQMIVNVPIIVIFSLIIAVILNQKFRGRMFVRAVFFLPVILGTTVVSLQDNFAAYLAMGGDNAETADASATMFHSGYLKFLLMQMINFGGSTSLVFINYIVGAVDRIYEIVAMSGVQILIFLAGLQTVSPQLYEAAKIEGATGYEAFWKITFPMMSPLILTNVVYSIIDSFGRNKILLRMNDAMFIQNNFGQSAAMAWVYFLTISLILAVAVGFISRKVFYYE